MEKVCIAVAKLPNSKLGYKQPSATTTNNLHKDFSFRAIKCEFIFNTLDY